MLTAYRKEAVLPRAGETWRPVRKHHLVRNPLPYLTFVRTHYSACHHTGRGRGGALLVASGPLVSGGRDTFGVARYSNNLCSVQWAST